VKLEVAVTMDVQLVISANPSTPRSDFVPTNAQITIPTKRDYAKITHSNRWEPTFHPRTFIYVFLSISYCLLNLSVYFGWWYASLVPVVSTTWILTLQDPTPKVSALDWTPQAQLLFIATDDATHSKSYDRHKIIK